MSLFLAVGHQGQRVVSQDGKDITTLGRGGTDTTAVALAAALGADYCEIYTDVDGVFTADPRIVPQAKRIPRISYEEMLEMAACGAKVLVLRCVEYARRYDIPVHVRSSFSQKEGTWILPDPPEGADAMEQAIIAGIAHDRSEAKVTVVGVPVILQSLHQGAGAVAHPSNGDAHLTHQDDSFSEMLSCPPACRSDAMSSFSHRTSRSTDSRPCRCNSRV